MQPLETTKLLLTWICMYPVTKPTDTLLRKKAIRAVIVLMLFGVALCTIFASSIYIVKNISVHFEDCIITLIAVPVYCGLIYTMIVAFFIRYQVPPIFDHLDVIYDDHNDVNDSMQFLIQANNTCEWMWIFYRKFSLFIATNISFLSVNSVLLCRLMDGDFIVEHFFRPLKLSLPWNQSTFLGYFEEQIFIFFMATVFFTINGVVLLPFTSICIHYRAFYQIIRNLVDRWNDATKNHRRDDNNVHDQKFICDLIRYDVSFKKLFSLSATLYSPFIMAQLTIAVISLAIFMVHFDLHAHDRNYSAILISMMGLASGIMILFPYCFFGKLTTENFSQMCDCIYDLNWLHLSIDLQKVVVLMIANMQQPIYYHGFEIVTLDLNTFIRLLRIIVRYYVMFKTISMQ